MCGQSRPYMRERTRSVERVTTGMMIVESAGIQHVPGALLVTVDRADTRDVPSLRVLFGRLDELSALREVWDSYGGLPPTHGPLVRRAA